MSITYYRFCPFQVNVSPFPIKKKIHLSTCCTNVNWDNCLNIEKVNH